MEELYKKLQNELRQLRESGLSDEEIAQSCGYDRSHINRLINGDPSRIGSMRLSSAIKLFPSLAGALQAQVDASNISSPHAVAACSDVSIQQLDIGVREKLDALASFVLKSSLSSEEKVMAMKLLH